MSAVAAPGPGHNSGASPIVAGKLKSFIERIERLEAEKAELAADVKEVYGEAKGEGYDTKIMRRMVRLRKLDKQQIAEQAELMEMYARALGMDPMFL